MKIALELTAIEARVLGWAVNEVLRYRQGDGELPDDEDDALVTLNDKIEAALKST